MNSRFLKYFLLLSAIVVWFLVIYRIVWSEKPESDSIISTKNQKKNNITRMTYILNYRDPFGKMESVNTVRKVIKKFTKTPFINNEFRNTEPVQLPLRVEFRGIVKNGNKALAIVNFDKKDLFVTNGDYYQGIRIYNVFKDSIILIYKNHKFTINRN